MDSPTAITDGNYTSRSARLSEQPLLPMEIPSVISVGNCRRNYRRIKTKEQKAALSKILVRISIYLPSELPTEINATDNI
jgi:hypothetical protein